MAAILRSGKYGSYYGNTYDTSNPLDLNQMQVNAEYICRALLSKGWTYNAICGMLGNMQAESSINPGRWQSDRVAGDANGHGYGLVQWTPYTKYIGWCGSNGYEDPSEMDANLARIIYEIENGIQWIATDEYPLSFKEFSTSTKDVRYLAKAFLLCYERPADQSSVAQNYRAGNAESWYNVLKNIKPVTHRKKRRGYKFILFNKKRKVTL